MYLDLIFIVTGRPPLFAQSLELGQLILEPLERYGRIFDIVRGVAARTNPNTLLVAWHVTVVGISRGDDA